MNTARQPCGRQRGIALVVVTIAMLALIAMAALALDVGHLTLNKARLQATVDAAALSAAKVLDTTGSTATATSAASSVLALNAARQPELQSAFGSMSQTVEYSNTVIPFAPGTNPPLYVRVTASGFSFASMFAQVLGINSFTIAANAVAGPSPTTGVACNIVPILLCGANPPPATLPIFGYSEHEIVALKLSAGSNPGNIGPGNYHLLSLGGNGGAVVRENLAGGYAGCLSLGQNVTTQPGNVSGPTAQGLNTRFGEYQGPVSAASYPPDVITTQPPSNQRLTCSDPTCTVITAGGNVITTGSQYAYSYENMYQPKAAAAQFDNPPAPAGNGVPDRRIVAVPVGDCTGGANGRSVLPVLGLACVFLLQDVSQQGNANQVFGEILSSCQVNGNPGPIPSNGPGPYVIQLYHVDGSPQA
jgi:Flp pilus assembly protein TadG